MFSSVKTQVELGTEFAQAVLAKGADQKKVLAAFTKRGQELEAEMAKALADAKASAEAPFAPHITVDEKGMLTLHFSGGFKSASNPYMTPAVFLRAEKMLVDGLAWAKENMGKEVATAYRAEVAGKWCNAEGTIVLGQTAPNPKSKSKVSVSGTVESKFDAKIREAREREAVEAAKAGK